MYAVNEQIRAKGDVYSSSEILSRIARRGYLTAGVSEGILGLSAIKDGQWVGFDADLARGLAAVVLSDPEAVVFRSIGPVNRFKALHNGDIDVGTYNASAMLTRELLDICFPVISLYDGEAAIVRKSSNVRSLRDFPSPRIAIQAGTSTKDNLIEYFGRAPYSILPVKTLEDAFHLYEEDQADAVVFDAIALAAMRTTLPVESEHEILPERFSKEAMGPVTVARDPIWSRTVAWTVRSLILAEELSLSASTIRQEAKNPSSPSIARFLDTGLPILGDDNLGRERLIGLIEAIGNYKEVFHRNLGYNSKLNLDRNLNRLWIDGGLLYSPPAG